MTEKVLLDCDPGHDDALAILFAHGSPEIELTAITTVAGNQTLDKTTLNARRVCTVAGVQQVPIAAGCGQPLVREQRIAANIHGESGLDGHVFDDPAVETVDKHAVDLIIDTVLRAPGEVNLVAIGPLTNIALAVRREPRVITSVKTICIMGGSYTRGNSTPAAEFNIFCDPEAAAIVFGAPWRVTMLGLDLTHQALATEEVVGRIAALDTPCTRLVVDLLTFYGATYREQFALDAPPVHDLCAVAYVARPDIFQTEEAFVAVETTGTWTAGMTVTDFSGHLGRPKNTTVVTSLDVAAFWSLFLEALANIGRS